MPQSSWQFSLDPYTPAEMAQKVETGGVAKARLGAADTFMLGVLAGAFIGLGAMFSTVVATGPGPGYGPTRLLVGLSFCLGLVLVVVGGAELLTGNNLLVMAWAHGRVGTGAVLRNWVIVYLGNFVGATATAVGVYLSGVWALGGYKVGATALVIAAGKCNLSWPEAFLRGVYCNALVCLAVWLAYSARTTTDKILSVLFPTTAFVAAGFEHSIANMYFIPMGLFLRGEGDILAAGSHPGADLSGLTWQGFLLGNLVPVTLANVAGGAVMVGLVYWFVYLRKRVEKAGKGADR
jgi:formate transporter